MRKNVNKATRAGLSVTIRDNYTNVREFTRLYQDTMTRRGAEPWYHFKPAFFVELRRSLPGGVFVAEVRDSGGILVSAEILLRSNRYLYSFLGGTLAIAFSLAPNDLLNHHVIIWGSQADLDGYILGGGHQADDGIFRYTLAFDTDGVRDFVGLHVTGNPSTADRLTRLRLGMPGAAVSRESPPQFSPRTGRPDLGTAFADRVRSNMIRTDTATTG